jgi:CubicO group peptidase (beta-lactamase class C family)
MRRLVASAALLLVVWLPAVHGQGAATRAESLPTSRTLDEKLESIRSKLGLPALGVAATSGERLLAIATAGFRKLGSEERVTPLDTWHLGSCTKSMTATMIARLVERGMLSFDSTLEGGFPELAGKMDASYRGVTLEQLLANRGGVPSDLSPGGLWGRLWERKGTPSDQREELARGVFERAPATRPGSSFLYSNAGFALAGQMAERATKKAWEALMQEELFAPLGMTSGGFGAPGNPDSVKEPWGHGAGGEPVPPGPHADNPPAIGPAGTAHLSLSDWARYAATHLRGARGRSDYLKAETFARLQAKPKVGEYAFGWAHATRPWANGPVLVHNGSNTMWFCVIWLAPERNVALLSVCNMGGAKAAQGTDEAVATVLDLVKDQLDKPAK